MAAVTLSGFNGIDFNTIITAIMQSESQPLHHPMRKPTTAIFFKGRGT